MVGTFLSVPSISFVIIFLSVTLSPSLPSAIGARAEAEEACQPLTCSGSSPFFIRFPFRMVSVQPARCGYRGFALSCHDNLTTLTLSSRPDILSRSSFLVQDIDYESQHVFLADPGGCLPRRVLEGSIRVAGTPFESGPGDTFAFYNCSSVFRDGMFVVPCLSGENHTVLVVRRGTFAPGFDDYMESVFGCELAKEVEVPGLWSARADVRETLALGWREPDCRRCESRGGTCGFKNRPSTEEIGCEGADTGLADGTKYSLIVSLGVPLLLCIVALAYTVGKRVVHRRRQAREAPGAAQRAVVIAGLDDSVIEKYPKIMLGESRRLPDPDDSTCPICLSEYEAKEELRTLPECSHYFHAVCIDEWLKVRGTCPLCRNSPERQ